MQNYRTESTKDLEATQTMFKMNEVTKKLNLTPRTIRYYESEGLLGEVTRSIGYTRYFSETAIKRLKEVKRLKKKRMKIAEIKALFQKKYPAPVVEQVQQLCISDVYLTQKDAETCLKENILVNESDIEFNAIKMKYLEWKKIALDEYEKPFKISANVTKSDVSIMIPDKKNTWLGNSNRGVVQYILSNLDKVSIDQEWLNTTQNESCEWCVYPVDMSAKDPYFDTIDDVFIIKKRDKNGETHHIVFKGQLFDVLERQFKNNSKQLSGLLKHVTLTIDPKHPLVDEFSEFINKMVPHKDLLTIDDMSPVYLKNLKDRKTILFSFV